MKFVQFRRAGLRPEVGILHEEKRILPLYTAFDQLLKNWKNLHKLSIRLNSLIDIIRAGDTYRPFFDALDEGLFQQRFPSKLFIDPPTVTLLSPLRPPGLLVQGYTFRAHEAAVREAQALEPRSEFESRPVYSYGNVRSVVDPGVLNISSEPMQKLDYQLEWAVVIGKPGRSIPAESADDHIFGYTVVNNWASRTIEEAESPMGLGPAASKDFATTVGPYVVTPDLLLDQRVDGRRGQRHDLWMRASVNDKSLSLGNSRDMSWTFAQLIEAVSRHVTLTSGDLITSGPVGSGTLLELNGSRKLENFWVKAGDEVKLSIDGLGEQISSIQLAE